MENFVYTDPSGNKIPVKMNKKLKDKSKNKKTSKLVKTIAVGGLVLAIGVGALRGCSLFNSKDNEKDNKPTTSATDATTPSVNEVKPELRYDPNSKESLIENATLLIEEASKAGLELDAEDAVLATIVANSNELTNGFMGQLFGEKADQTYTYNTLTDAYLRVCLMQVENIGVAKDEEVAFNIENVFASQEDYEYLSTIRTLTNRFNNSTDENEKAEITEQLNQIASSLCTAETFDISSPASILSMLSLDGMHIITANSNNVILHDDIRDEMFGTGDYSCNDNQVIYSQYSNRVSDLKLDVLKNKLDNAVLEEGKTTILDEVIEAVKSNTKDEVISDFDAKEEINNEREENRDVVYEYEEEPGVEKDDYSEITEDDVIINVNGEDVVVVPSDNVNKDTTKEENQSEKNDDAQVEETTIDTTTITPTEPEIKEETNVTPEAGEEVVDTGDVTENKEQAEEELQNEWEIAQAESLQGSIDGAYYGMKHFSKPSFEGKSQYYIDAFVTNYDFWIAQPQMSDEEIRDLLYQLYGYELSLTTDNTQNVNETTEQEKTR